MFSAWLGGQGLELGLWIFFVRCFVFTNLTMRRFEGLDSPTSNVVRVTCSTVFHFLEALPAEMVEVAF